MTPLIDVASNKVTSINLNGSITNFIAINPKGDKLFFHKSVNEIGVLNLKDQNQIQIISSSHFNQPNFLSVSSDGTKLYVCNNSSPTVSVVDILTNLWICDINISLPNDLNPPFIGPYYFSLNPRQNRALVNNSTDLYLVNVNSNSVISKLNDENNLPYGIAFNSTGTKGYIVAGNKVEVFDSESNALVNPIELNVLASYIAITPIPYLPTFTQFLQRVCPVKYQRRL